MSLFFPGSLRLYDIFTMSSDPDLIGCSITYPRKFEDRYALNLSAKKSRISVLSECSLSLALTKVDFS